MDLVDEGTEFEPDEYDPEAQDANLPAGLVASPMSESDSDYALAPPPRILSPEAIRRLGALTTMDDRSEAVEQQITDQEQVYRSTFKRAGVEPLIEALLARDRQLMLDGRRLADGTMQGRLLREFVRGLLIAADKGTPQAVEKLLVGLGAEPADARQLKLHGSTLGPLEDPKVRAEGLASGERKE